MTTYTGYRCDCCGKERYDIYAEAGWIVTTHRFDVCLDVWLTNGKTGNGYAKAEKIGELLNGSCFCSKECFKNYLGL